MPVLVLQDEERGNGGSTAIRSVFQRPPRRSVAGTRCTANQSHLRGHEEESEDQGVWLSGASDPCLLSALDHAGQGRKGNEGASLYRRPGLDFQEAPLHQESRVRVGVEELHHLAEP